LGKLDPERVPAPTLEEVAAHRHLIRHAADVPVLLSALQSRPNFLVTSNVRHFTPRVAHRTGLRIVTPAQLLRRLRIIQQL